MKDLFNNKKEISRLQITLTILLVIGLILSNILTIKPINLFGLKLLAGTAGIMTFPLTYILSDVFSEVYGYEWSRITAKWATIGTALATILFQLTILIPGSENWTQVQQTALQTTLGNTPLIAIASILAFYFGDLINDKIFQKMKEKNGSKWFQLRAIVSSLGGKWVDGLIFNFIGLHFLPLETKIIMILVGPFVQILIETICLPITTLIKNKLKKIEG